MFNFLFEGSSNVTTCSPYPLMQSDVRSGYLSLLKCSERLSARAQARGGGDAVPMLRANPSGGYWNRENGVPTSTPLSQPELHSAGVENLRHARDVAHPGRCRSPTIRVLSRDLGFRREIW
eukprot:307615-Prorocentrum_minimum.AAC.4